MPATLPRRAFLGAELPDDREAFTADGVRIVGVAADSMAARAGLAADDVVVSLARMPVRNLRELASALRAAGGAPTTTLAFLRAGARFTVDVDVVPFPQEPDAVYAELAGLRTIATTGSRATIVLVPGIAAESVEGSPYAQLAAAWTRAGYATLRFDKRGVGDSSGDVADFATDLADARAIIDRARPPVIVFGHSVGGIIAAQLPARGLIVYGTPVMRWIECLLDSVRRQMRGAPADAIEAQLTSIRELARTGELNGRSAAYHAQLDALDLEALWRAVTAPVLVLRGEYDWVVRADDQARIAALAHAELVDLAKLDHLFGVHADREASMRDYGCGEVDDRVVTATLPWLDRVVSQS